MQKVSRALDSIFICGAGFIEKGVEFNGLKNAEIQFDPSRGNGSNHRLKVTVPHPDSPPPHPKFPNNQYNLDVASMSWHPQTGRVEGIRTEKDFQHQGHASALWQHAEKISKEHGLVPPQHSEVQTPEGKAWVEQLEKRRRM